MIILIATLFIDLAVFAHSTGSPERLPTQIHSADGPAGTSGRKFDEVIPDDVIKSQTRKITNMLFSELCHHDEKGIFYEENGHDYPVKRGIPLLEHRGYIVGRPKNGIVHPIFNSEHKPVFVAEDNYKLQCFPSREHSFHTGEPIPPQYSVVYPFVPHEPKVKVQSPASSKKSGKLHSN